MFISSGTIISYILPTEIANVSYSQNPFIPAKDIADYIKHNTTDTDKIAVLGSEPEIYFYSGRKAATGYLYTYPLVEDQPYNLIMQNEMINEIEKNKPKYLTFCNCTYSWVTKQIKTLSPPRNDKYHRARGPPVGGPVDQAENEAEHRGCQQA